VTTLLHHGPVELALHEVRSGSGRPLVLLHGLGEAAAATVPNEAGLWPGPVLALDFTGHGASSVPVGGGYSPEILMSDVDAVIVEVGPLTVLGRGLGAYVGLLIAGARPHAVQGAVLADGPGLGGGASHAGGPPVMVAGHGEGAPDRFALAELAQDPRPPAYAASFARRASQGSGRNLALVVAAAARPRWIEAVVAEPGVVQASIEDGLALFAGAGSGGETTGA
jgi:pimeloyl-ACP methyl ester carboxylesterase